LELAQGNPQAALTAANQAVEILSKAAPQRLPADLALRAYATKAALGADAPAFDGFTELARETKAGLTRAVIQRASQSEAKIAEAVLVELRDRLAAEPEGGDAGQRLSVQIALSQVAKETGNHELRIGAARQAVQLCEAL